MADIPNGPVPGMSGYDMATPTPRPIASPFGALPGLRAPTPTQQPGFNVADPGTPAGWLPEWLAQLMPSGQDWKQGIAGNLGFPVDALGWLAHRAGLKVPGGAPPDWTPTEQNPTPYWAPSADVPLSSQNIRRMLDNPPPLDAFLQAMRRHGPF